MQSSETRLVYILLSPTPGMHQYTSDLANRMSELVETHLVTTDNYPADRYSPRVHVHTPVRFRSTGLSVDSLRLNDILRLRLTLMRLRPEVVHFTGPHLWNTPFVHWLSRRGVEVIHTIHDADPHPGTQLGALLGHWNRSVMGAATAILVHSNEQRQRLLDRHHTRTSVVSLPLLHLFVGFKSLEKLEDGEEEMCLGPSILFFGRIEPYKGVETLIAAHQILLRQAAAESREPPQLTIAGSGRLPQKYRDALGSSVTLLNHFVDDDVAIGLFRQSCVVALPYHQASQSALIASAYYFQKPVVASRVGAFDEYVLEGETGYLVEPGKPEALAEALGRLIWNPERRRVMGATGRAWYDKQRAMETGSLKGLYAQFKAERGV